MLAFSWHSVFDLLRLLSRARHPGDDDTDFSEKDYTRMFLIGVISHMTQLKKS